jgi:hypothetical protein
MNMKAAKHWMVPAVVALLLSACGRGSRDGNSIETSVSPDRYEEGDTLLLAPGQVPGLQEWIDYHRLSDTGLWLSAMPASGVVIHIDPLDSMSMPVAGMPDTLLAWSPDRSKYIDIWSYNHIVDTLPTGALRITGGGPEQIVALGDRGSRRRHILMFNGTGQIAESADWLDNQTFLLGMMLIDEATGARTPEIMLFSLSDSVFTDFRYIRSIPGDSLPPTPGGFARHWWRRRGLQTE